MEHPFEPAAAAPPQDLAEQPFPEQPLDAYHKSLPDDIRQKLTELTGVSATYLSSC